MVGLGKSIQMPFDMVVVDNGSADGTVSYFDSRDFDTDIGNKPDWKQNKLSNLFITDNKENKGIAIGRNQALKHGMEGGYDWLVTLDNDVEMPEGWLEEAISILSANRSYGAIGVNMENTPYPLVTKNGFTFQDKPAGNLGTACIVFPKSTPKMLGYFNTEYGRYGEEDADYGMRIRVAGFKLGYIERMGTHFGEGELDKGEYREFKTKAHRDNLRKFQENCAAYAQRRKPIFIPYKD
jgi:GT2 family glycosyltransferase